MTTGNEEWEDSPQVEKEAVSNHPSDRPRGTQPVPIVPDEPEKVATVGAVATGKPKINWTQLLLGVILAAVLAGAFVIQWAPSKADMNILRSDMAEAVESIASRNGTIDNLVVSMGELRMKVDSLINSDFLSEDALEDAVDGLVTEDELDTFMDSVLAQIGTIVLQDMTLGLSTTYERDEMQFNVSKAADNTTAYFTIEGAVYYDSTLPATPTPTPMLDGFELVYATEGMSMFAMTTFGKTETGGVKGYDFEAPVGTWYYNFWITPLSIGGNVTSGSTW